MNRLPRFETPRGLRMIRRIVDLLKLAKEPMTITEMAGELHCTPENVRQYVVHLVALKEGRQVRIAKWQQSGTRWVAMYKAGSGPNKRKPKALTKADLHRNMMADPVAHAKELAYRRKRYRIRRGLPPIVTPAAPWFGPLVVPEQAAA